MSSHTVDVLSRLQCACLENSLQHRCLIISQMYYLRLRDGQVLGFQGPFYQLSFGVNIDRLACNLSYIKNTTVCHNDEVLNTT